MHVSARCSKSNSELLLDWGAWDIVDTIGFLDALVAWHLGATELAITNKWHSATAVGSLASHGVDANDHSDDPTVQEDEPKDPDGDDNIEEDLVLWLPLDVSILIHLTRHSGGARCDQNHYELNQK